MALWANLHGSFVVGVGLLGLVTAVEGARSLSRAPTDDALLPPEWRRLCAWSTCAILATLLNPRGIRIYTFAFSMAHTFNGSFGEWARPLFQSPFGARFYVLNAFAAALLARVWAVTRRVPAPADLCAWMLLFVAAMTSARYIVWLGLASGPLVADALTSLVSSASRTPFERGGQAATRAGLGFVVAVTAVVLGVWWKRVLNAPHFEPYANDTPIAAVERLRALDASERPKRLFHNEGVGSYLLWAAPEQPIFIDPHFALYPPEQIADLIRITNLVDLDSLVAKYRFDGMLLEEAHQATLLQHLSADPAWRAVFADATSALFVRARPAPPPLGSGDTPN